MVWKVFFIFFFIKLQYKSPSYKAILFAMKKKPYNINEVVYLEKDNSILLSYCIQI
jgi:hypothetical protein